MSFIAINFTTNIVEDPKDKSKSIVLRIETDVTRFSVRIAVEYLPNLLELFHGVEKQLKEIEALEKAKNAEPELKH